jgi:hypothetical protein
MSTGEGYRAPSRNGRLTPAAKRTFANRPRKKVRGWGDLDLFYGAASANQWARHREFLS